MNILNTLNETFYLNIVVTYILGDPHTPLNNAWSCHLNVIECSHQIVYWWGVGTHFDGEVAVRSRTFLGEMFLLGHCRQHQDHSRSIITQANLATSLLPKIKKKISLKNIFYEPTISIKEKVFYNNITNQGGNCMSPVKSSKANFATSSKKLETF